tara:strand:+ start:590 stop:1336 length:747 start_codon:yes stop_codon:yes gene_type:complete
MPDKEGSDDEKKSTKGVVNKKQKQMMNQEQLDISSVAKSFGGQIIGEPVELDELVVTVPTALTIGALAATGVIGVDSYEKLRGKKGILPDLTPVVKGAGDTYNKVKNKILKITKRNPPPKDGEEKKLDGQPERGVRTKDLTPELKKRRKQLDKDTYQGTKDKFFNKNKNNKNGDENKTLGNIVKIGGAGAGGAAITNIVKQNQSQKTNQKKKTPTITKTNQKQSKSGKLPGIRFPGTAHIVGRRSNPQ